MSRQSPKTFRLLGSCLRPHAEQFGTLWQSGQPRYNLAMLRISRAGTQTRRATDWPTPLSVTIFDLVRVRDDPDVRVEGVTVVLRGAFNPPLFSPGWLLANKLISKDEHDDSATEAIVPQLSIFRTPSLRFQVTPDSLAVDTESQIDFEAVRDMVLEILQTLPHMPVNLLGINHYYHVAMPSLEAWHKVGDQFAPKNRWEQVLKLPGTQNVTINSIRTDQYEGAINASIQPSNRYWPGVFVFQNDHFVLKLAHKQPETRIDFGNPHAQDREIPKPSPEMIDHARAILSTEWRASNDRAGSILQLVWDTGVS